MPQSTLSPAIIGDKNTRQVIQGFRTQLDQILGSGVSEDLKYISVSDLLATGIVSKDASGNLVANVPTTSQTQSEGFLDWLQNDFLAGTYQRINFTIGPEVANTINVSAQVLDANNDPVVGIQNIEFYISNSGIGGSFASVLPDGGIIQGTDGDVLVHTPAQSLEILTNSSGLFDVDVIHSAADTFYLVAVLENRGTIVSPAITFV